MKWHIKLMILILSLLVLGSQDLLANGGGQVMPLTKGGADISGNWALKSEWFAQFSQNPQSLYLPIELLTHFYEAHPYDARPPLGCAAFYERTCKCDSTPEMPYFNAGPFYVGGGC